MPGSLFDRVGFECGVGLAGDCCARSCCARSAVLARAVLAGDCCARSCGAQGYTFEQLRDCELRAAAWLNCIDITQRFQSFRNALVNVALEHAQVLATLPNAQALAIPDADNPHPHVLIVDDSDITCEIHTACVRNFRQNATVHACHRSEDVKPNSCGYLSCPLPG